MNTVTPVGAELWNVENNAVRKTELYRNLTHRRRMFIMCENVRPRRSFFILLVTLLASLWRSVFTLSYSSCLSQFPGVQCSQGNVEWNFLSFWMFKTNLWSGKSIVMSVWSFMKHQLYLLTSKWCPWFKEKGSRNSVQRVLNPLLNRELHLEGSTDTTNASWSIMKLHMDITRNWG